MSIENPCASMIASVQPSRQEASSSSARRLVQPTLYYAQASAVLDHSITLPQRDGDAGPTLARGEIGSERNLIVLDAGDVLHDAFVVGGPGINAEGEVSRASSARAGSARPAAPGHCRAVEDEVVHASRQC